MGLTSSVMLTENPNVIVEVANQSDIPCSLMENCSPFPKRFAFTSLATYSTTGIFLEVLGEL